MPYFEVKIRKKLIKYIKKLDKKTQKKVVSILEIFSINPVPFNVLDVKKIVGSKDKYRVRFGNYRLAYRVLFEDKMVWVLKIEKRKERTYKKNI